MFDGFEAAPVLRNSMSLSGGSISSVTGRDGAGKGIKPNVNAVTSVPFPTNIATTVLGLGVKLAGTTGWGATSAGAFIFDVRGDAGATGHLGLNVAADGKMTLRRGGGASGTIIATSVPSITGDAWHYLECKWTIADSGGIFICKVDGVEFINFTGDTKNAGTLTSTSGITLGYMSNSINFDDLYVLDCGVDGTGLTPPQKAAYQDFIGERVVKVSRPDGIGASTGWTPNTAVDNYTTQDEDPWTTTDYVTAGTAGLSDYYTFSDVVGLSAVDAIQEVAYALKPDAGARVLRTLERTSGGTTRESSDLALATTVAAIQGPIRGKDADGAAFTQSSFNSSQFGIKSN
jgi:hypothetical protein